MDHSDTTVTPQQYVWWGKDFKSVFLVVYGPCLHSDHMPANSNRVRVVYVVGWKNADRIRLIKEHLGAQS